MFSAPTNHMNLSLKEGNRESMQSQIETNDDWSFRKSPKYEIELMPHDPDNPLFKLMKELVERDLQKNS